MAVLKIIQELLSTPSILVGLMAFDWFMFTEETSRRCSKRNN